MGHPKLGRSEQAILGITVALFAAPLLVRLCFGERDVPFQLLAADAFYYLTVARNTVALGMVSFDQETLTNGFHPLWQALGIGLYGIGKLFSVSQTTQIHLPLVCGMVLVAAAIPLLALTVRVDGRLTPLFVVLPLGVTSLLAMPLMTLLWKPYRASFPPTSLWGNVNGMESALVVLAFAVVSYLFVHQDRTTARAGIGFGLALVALTLARLDHGVFALCLLLLPLLDASRTGKATTSRANAAARFAWSAAAAFGGVLGIYLLQNQLWFDAALPVSGTFKSSFPEMTPSNLKLLKLVFSGTRGLLHTHAFRGLQLILPVAFALVFLGSRFIPIIQGWRAARKQPASAAGHRTASHTGIDLKSRYEQLLVACGLGVIVLFLYNFLFVPAMAQGHWYFPLSNLVATLFVLHLLGSRLSSVFSASPRRALSIALVGAVGIALYPKWITKKRSSERSETQFFYHDAPALRQHFAGHEPRVVAFDDGLFAFATGFPCLSGMGLTLDTHAVRRLKRHRSMPALYDILRLGHARGYRHFTGGVSYVKQQLTWQASRKRIESVYWPLFGRKLNLDKLSVAFTSKHTSLSLIRIDEKMPAGAK